MEEEMRNLILQNLRKLDDTLEQLAQTVVLMDARVTNSEVTADKLAKTVEDIRSRVEVMFLQLELIKQKTQGSEKSWDRWLGLGTAIFLLLLNLAFEYFKQ